MLGKKPIQPQSIVRSVELQNKRGNQYPSQLFMIRELLTIIIIAQSVLRLL